MSDSREKADEILSPGIVCGRGVTPLNSDNKSATRSESGLQ